MSREHSKQNNNSKDNGSGGENRSNTSLDSAIDDDDQPMGEVIQNILATIINSMTEPFAPAPSRASTPSRNSRTSFSSSPPPLLSPIPRLNSPKLSPFFQAPDIDIDEEIDLEELVNLLRANPKNTPMKSGSIRGSPTGSWDFKNDWSSPKDLSQQKSQQLKNRLDKRALPKVPAKFSHSMDLDDDDDDEGWQFVNNRTRGNRRKTAGDRLQKQVESIINDDTELVQELCDASCQKLLATMPEYETRLKHAFDDAFQNMAKQQVELIGHLGELDKVFTVLEGVFREKIEQYRSAGVRNNPEDSVKTQD